MPTEQLGKLAWQTKNFFTYEGIWPAVEKNNLFKYMAEDLENFFNHTASIIKKRMKCLTLVRTSQLDKLKSKGRDRTFFDPLIDTTKLQLYVSRTSKLLEALSKANKNTPLIFADNVNYAGVIDIELNRSALNNIPALRTELNKYDLDLIEKETEVEIFVFTDKAAKAKFKR